VVLDALSEIEHEKEEITPSTHWMIRGAQKDGGSTILPPQSLVRKKKKTRRHGRKKKEGTSSVFGGWVRGGTIV
jgi:hypothetical protein